MKPRTFALFAASLLTIAAFGGCVAHPQAATTAARASGSGPEGARSLAESPASGADEASVSVTLAPAGRSAESTDSAAVVSPAARALPLEVTELVQRLTEPTSGRTLGHRVAATTGFPAALATLATGAQAPAVDTITYRSSSPPVRGLTADGSTFNLVERDWSGIVLVPIQTDFSRAHTTLVHLARTEAHPTLDGRVRVWIRLQNVDNRNIPVEVACLFQVGGGRPSSPNFYTVTVPAGAFGDVFFVSPLGDLASYTVLVRPNRASLTSR